MENAFQLDVADDRIAVLTVDQPGSKVNTLSAPVFEELGDVVRELEGRRELQGLLLRSGKPGQFIAGADLKELAALAHGSQERAGEFLIRGHLVFDRIACLPWPTVALIDGPCLGGGTEFALAMDYRIVSDSPRTQIGLPEVNLGIIPSWGGTQRLPRLIDVPTAIDMICSCKPVAGAQAARLGLVSDVVPAERLVEAGRRLIEQARASGEWEPLRERRQLPVGSGGGDLDEVFAGAEADLKRKTKGHYPAPLVALRAIREGSALPLAEGLKVEHAASQEVAGTRISSNLIAVFLMKQRLGRDPGVEDRHVVPRDVGKAGVVGAGLMGSGIAAAHARRGIPTSMVDLDQDRIEDGLARAREVVAGRIKIGRATPQDLDSMLGKLSTSTDHAIFADCDLVVEAISEDRAMKEATYQALAGVLGSDTILASNTSTISISRLARSAPDPGRFIGMHFFNPVDRMQLVEVVRGERTSDETVATAVALARRIGKTPVIVRDSPGFLVNRVLFPYLNEAVLLLLEGASMEAIDGAATRFGMPMGPLLLNDVIGLDTVLSANTVLRDAYGDRAVRLPILDEMVESGRLGQKSGAGFRKYDAADPKGTTDPDFEPLLEKHRTATRELSDAEITDRLLLPMLLEASRALEENIVREPAHVDMSLILAVGFPQFRGGLLRWCDDQGADNLMRRAESYVALGKRFEPTDTLRRLADAAERFYPSSPV
jgi:3-hydroxyacyl-CoA dehydrogenase/enoyl-CoA hydratase/3-hydroxybutyryl-CoA epimerase/3-hydroxyacyl-CoA dehydrogenase/enoyl-CoA hydratase/3-hydroxybutyryl-CoA epimerase/enoyl-CoA isomerase